MGRSLRHLLLATLEDPEDPSSWSGIPFSLRSALEGRVERVTVLSRLKPKRTPGDMALRVLLGGTPPRYPLWMTDAALRNFARTLDQAVASEKPEAVLCISSQCLIYLPKQPVPVAMFADAPWLAWKQAYRRYESIPLPGRAYARKEASSAGRCDALFFASQWATNEAQRLYGITDDRLHVTPLGASWVPELSREELVMRIRGRDRGTLRLLFVGKDWERKGGPLAVEIALELNRSGQRTELHIVGCRPRIEVAIDGGFGARIPAADRQLLRIHGLLSRNNPGENATMRELFLDSHFLVVPTDAECFGIVFAEALAHGLPAVSRRVDAVPSIVNDGVDGILEDRTALAAPYAKRILDTFRSLARYEAMAVAGRTKYESSLTWDACAEKIVRVLDRLLQ